MRGRPAVIQRVCLCRDPALRGPAAAGERWPRLQRRTWATSLAWALLAQGWRGSPDAGYPSSLAMFTHFVAVAASGQLLLVGLSFAPVNIPISFDSSIPSPTCLDGQVPPTGQGVSVDDIDIIAIENDRSRSPLCPLSPGVPHISVCPPASRNRPDTAMVTAVSHPVFPGSLISEARRHSAW